MVQRKTVQKKETKTPTATNQKTKAKAASLKTSKKQPIKVLSNGYGSKNIKEIENAKSVEKIDNTDLIATVALEEVPKSSEKAEISVDMQTEPGTSKGSKKTDLKSSRAKIPSSEENVKIDIVSETIPKIEKSRKRKLPDKTESSENVKSLTKSKTKLKKQKVLLRVPPLQSIPGKVFVVGENDVGQLGIQDEDVESKEKPFLLDLPHSFIDVAAGGMHSVCLTENGEVITFGCNDEGALGRVTADEIEERTPKLINIPEKIVQISAGDSHSAALAESGHVYIWGNFRNGEGQMGLTADGNKSVVPLKVLSDVTVVKIASGGDHLVCLADDGIVYTCGCGEQGQLGRITSRSSRNGGRKGLAALLEPAPVDKLTARVPVNDVWTESYATFLKAQENGSIYAFGLNNYSQLGYENSNEEQENQMKFFPESISSFNNKSWLQINGGQHHTLALDSDGLVYSLGRKDYGRLGLGENCEDRSAPTVIHMLQTEKCSTVSCGNCVSFAVTEQGSLYSWGMGSSQLGHGNDEDIHTPRLIKGELLNAWKVHKVSGGGQHALILACPKKTSSKKT